MRQLGCVFLISAGLDPVPTNIYTLCREAFKFNNHDILLKKMNTCSMQVDCSFALEVDVIGEYG